MADESENDEGRFSKEERAAMKQRAAELREQKKLGKGAERKEREAQACLDAIAALEGTDRQIAERLHAIVTDAAPQLDPKTWYGFPTYALDGKRIVFYQPASKFGTRYGSIGFEENASLDDGTFWPVAFAVLEITDAVEKELRSLIARAVG
jgi:uncharacterized protein YdhG (YjbR/CyaY superfamily)